MNGQNNINRPVKKSRAWRIAAITAASLVGAILLGAVSYLLYVVFSYYRVEDKQELTVYGEAVGAVPVGDELTLVTYNIGFGAYSDDYSFFMDEGEHSRAFSKEAVLENTEGALGAIGGQSPHFVMLQEVDVDGTRSYHVDQTRLMAKGLSGYDRVYGQNYDSPYFLYPFNEPIGANEAGMMTFSAYDISSAVRRSLPIEESLYKYLDLDRCYTVSTVEAENGKSLVLYNVHLSAYTSDGTIADEQMKMLAADMEAQYKEGNYVIAAGDFNKDLLGNSSEYFKRDEGDYTWAKPFDTRLLPEGMTHHTGSNVPTCRNADSPYRGDGTDFVLSVDGVIVSGNIEVLSCATVDTAFAYSDHNPVSLQFKLK